MKRSVDGIGIDKKIIRYKGSWISFEESDKCIWILACYTKKTERNRGQMRKLISFLKALKKPIDFGAFTDDGEKYIKKYRTDFLI